MHGKRHSHLPFILADLGLVLFVICFFWGYVIPADLREMHQDMLRMTFLGWSGMNIASFLLGAVQSVLWGLLIGWKVSWMKRMLWKKCPHEKGCCSSGEKHMKEPAAMEQKS